MNPLDIGSLGNKPEFIIVHCTASPRELGGKTVDRDMVHAWHLANKWSGIGYHWVVLANDIQPGRNEDRQGAHCPGYNDKSVGIVWAGGLTKNHGNFPIYETQRVLLLEIVASRAMAHEISPQAILGHNETASGMRQGKLCPCLDMEVFRADLAGLLEGMVCRER